MMSLSPGRCVSAVRSVVIDRPLEQTLSLVRDIEPLERKVRSVEADPTDADSGWHRIRGKLARLVPWTGLLVIAFRERLAQSQPASARGHLAHIWRLRRHVDRERRCRVTHYEDYGPPAHLRHGFLVAYMRLSQVGEMRDLKRLVESRVPQTRVPTTAR